MKIPFLTFMLFTLKKKINHVFFLINALFFVLASGKQIADRNTGRGKSAHLAQRKALTDVINDPASRNTKENRSTINKDEFCSSLKSSCKVAYGIEDLHGNLGHTERDLQKTAQPLQVQTALLIFKDVAN